MFVDAWDGVDHIGRGAIDLVLIRRREHATEEWINVYGTDSDSSQGLVRVIVEYSGPLDGRNGDEKSRKVVDWDVGATPPQVSDGDGSTELQTKHKHFDVLEHEDVAGEPATQPEVQTLRRATLPAYWEIAVSRSTGRRYFVNSITGESQYEVPDDGDDMTTKHYAAKIIQQAWRGAPCQLIETTDDLAAESEQEQESTGLVGITWEEVDLTFETEGALGLVFSSETETATKVVTEVVPGKLASQVPELSSAFDIHGKPIPGQVRLFQ